MIIARSLDKSKTDFVVVGLEYAILDLLRAGDVQNFRDPELNLAIRIVAGRDTSALLQIFKNSFDNISTIRRVP